MAIYCNTKGCPVQSMSGLDSPKQHGRVVRCFECGKPMSATPGKGRKASGGTAKQQTVEQRFPVGAKVKQRGYQGTFEVVGHWRGEPRLKEPRFGTTHVAPVSELSRVGR